MSKEISLTVQEAATLLQELQLDPSAWRGYENRSDTERLAIGVFVLSLVNQGKSLRTIEKETGIPRSTVLRYRDLALKSVQIPTVDEARKLEIERLEGLMEVWLPKAMTGDKDALAGYMKLSTRLGEITGTNRPVQVEAVVHEITAQERELARLVEEAKKREEQNELEILDEPSS